MMGCAWAWGGARTQPNRNVAPPFSPTPTHSPPRRGRLEGATVWRRDRRRYGCLSGNIFFRDIMGVAMSSDPRTLLTHPTVTAAASSLGCTPAQLLLQWSVQHGVTNIPKASSIERVKENLAALDVRLPPTMVAALNEFRDPNYTTAAALKTLQERRCGCHCRFHPRSATLTVHARHAHTARCRVTEQGARVAGRFLTRRLGALPQAKAAPGLRQAAWARWRLATFHGSVRSAITLAETCLALAASSPPSSSGASAQRGGGWGGAAWRALLKFLVAPAASTALGLCNRHLLPRVGIEYYVPWKPSTQHVVHLYRSERHLAAAHAAAAPTGRGGRPWCPYHRACRANACRI